MLTLSGTILEDILNNRYKIVNPAVSKDSAPFSEDTLSVKKAMQSVEKDIGSLGGAFYVQDVWDSLPDPVPNMLSDRKYYEACRLPYDSCWFEFLVEKNSRFKTDTGVLLESVTLSGNWVASEIFSLAFSGDATTAHRIAECVEAGQLFDDPVHYAMRGYIFLRGLPETGVSRDLAFGPIGKTLFLFGENLRSLGGITVKDPVMLAVQRRVIPEQNKTFEESIQNCFNACFRTSSLLNSKNVSIVNLPWNPHGAESLEAKEKGLLFKTLQIKGSKNKVIYDGRVQLDGDTTRLRLHTVRGHFKTYHSDKPLFGSVTGRFWWSPSAHGDSKVGEIVKDYNLELEDNQAVNRMGKLRKKRCRNKRRKRRR